MKGQFFLIGAVFLILIFYIGISAYISPSFMKPSLGKSTENLFNNIKNEYPKVLNFGLNASSPVRTLVNFTNFAVDMSSGRGSDFRVLWLVTENVSDNLNVSVGNFLGYPLDIDLSISGDTENLYLSDGETGSVLFTSPASEFKLVLNFNTTEKNVLLEKYKTNLYSVLEITKGYERITGEIKA